MLENVYLYIVFKYILYEMTGLCVHYLQNYNQKNHIIFEENSDFTVIAKCFGCDFVTHLSKKLKINLFKVPIRCN